MESDGSKGDQYRKKYPDFTPLSREEIDIYLGFILANGINMKPQINFWFLQTHYSTIYGNNNISMLFPRGRRIWEKFKHFFCTYDSCTDTKPIAAKHSLFKVCRMLQHLHRNFDLYWDPAWYLSINEKTIGFQDRHKYKLWITFKDVGDGFQAYYVCDCGYTYSFSYCNDDIPYSKHYLCATSERVI